MSERVRIKMCGLTRLEDVELAVQLGADFLGFVFVPHGPRMLTLEEAARLLEDADTAGARRVGVFGDQPASFVNDVVGRFRLDLVQLHATGDRADAEDIEAPLIRVVHVPSRADAVAEPLGPAVFDAHTFAILVDAQDASGHSGGLGVRPDAARLESALARLPSAARVILAGGLTPENVREVARSHRPYAVDVASGVESAPGIKDAKRMRAFVAALEDS